jgi:hypothetical protein
MKNDYLKGYLGMAIYVIAVTGSLILHPIGLTTDY